MKRLLSLKSAMLLAAAAGIFAAGVMTGANNYKQPSSVIHVVTVKWKSDSTPEQQKQVIDGVKTMASEIPGVRNIWIKSTRVQPNDYNAAFAIEFEDRAAADRYADHPAHKAWQKVYEPVHEESRSQQITN